MFCERVNTREHPITRRAPAVTSPSALLYEYLRDTAVGQPRPWHRLGGFATATQSTVGFRCQRLAMRSLRCGPNG